MADENRFAGISEQLGGGGSDEEGETRGDESEVRSGEDEIRSAEDDETGDDSVEAKQREDENRGEEQEQETEETEEKEDGEGGPAFSFEATAQTSIYPRAETVEDTLDDAEFEVEGILRREHDVRDLAGRELHDAMIRLAAERPEDLAELVVQARDDSE